MKINRILGMLEEAGVPKHRKYNQVANRKTGAETNTLSLRTVRQTCYQLVHRAAPHSPFHPTQNVIFLGNVSKTKMH